MKFKAFFIAAFFAFTMANQTFAAPVSETSDTALDENIIATNFPQPVLFDDYDDRDNDYYYNRRHRGSNYDRDGHHNRRHRGGYDYDNDDHHNGSDYGDDYKGND